MKKGFGLLTFILICLINFCNASDFREISKLNISIAGGGTTTLDKGHCFNIASVSCANNLKFYDNGQLIDYTLYVGPLYCVDKELQLKNNSSSSCTIYRFSTVYDNISTYCPTCPTCPTCDPQYTSQECQSVYGLVSSGSLLSCENDLSNCNSSLNTCQANTSGFNELLNNCSLSLNACNSSLTSCLQANCPEIDYSGGNWSALYINDIQHLGKPIINITFPDYLDRDYISTGDIFNLDIVGYPVDTEYIDGIIRTQNYKPTSEDFTSLVQMLAPYSKYLIFLLFVVFVWAGVKNIFKSKKL